MLVLVLELVVRILMVLRLVLLVDVLPLARDIHEAVARPMRLNKLDGLSVTERFRI
jgi:hypothetical protein